MATQLIGVKEFRNNLASLARQARQHGTRYIVLNKNVPLWDVRPLPAKEKTLEKLIPKDQAWFFTPEWQAKEQEADEDIRLERVSGPFSSAKDLIRSLRKKE